MNVVEVQLQLNHGNFKKENMKKHIIMSLFIPLLLCSCSNKITLDGFKQKYDTKEVVITLSSYGGRQGNSKRFTFVLNNKKYSVYPHFPDRLHVGMQFEALIDINNPKENYYILWDKIIRPNIPDESYYAKIEDVFILSKEDFAIVEFSFYMKNSKFLNFIGINSRKLAINSKYFQFIKKIKEQKIDLVLDSYVVNIYNGESIEFYDINYEYLDSLIVKLNL